MINGDNGGYGSIGMGLFGVVARIIFGSELCGAVVGTTIGSIMFRGSVLGGIIGGSCCGLGI